MIKYITANYEGDGKPLLRVLEQGLIKGASSVGEIVANSGESRPSLEGLGPHIIDYVNNVLLNGKQPNEIYILVNAVAAWEAWGANKNGDAFPEEMLRECHSTFELYGNVFREHKHTDKNNAIGRVVKSFYTWSQKRVQLIIAVYKDKAKDIVDKINKGQAFSVSMGIHVPYDICSICGNRAKARKFYCEHLAYHMGEILEDGRQVCAINPPGKFFDLSVVGVGADETAWGLQKVASVGAKPNSHTVTPWDFSQKKQASSVTEEKIENIVAGVPEANLAINEVVKHAPVFLAIDKDLPEEFFEKVVPYHSTDEIVSSCASIGIPLKPREFIRIILIKEFDLSSPATRGVPQVIIDDTAAASATAMLETKDIAFRNIASLRGAVNSEIVKYLAKIGAIKERSFAYPFPGMRLAEFMSGNRTITASEPVVRLATLDKTAGIATDLLTVGGLYLLSKKAPVIGGLVNKAQDTMKKHPWLIPATLGLALAFAPGRGEKAISTIMRPTNVTKFSSLYQDVMPHLGAVTPLTAVFPVAYTKLSTINKDARAMLTKALAPRMVGHISKVASLKSGRDRAERLVPPSVSDLMLLNQASNKLASINNIT